MAHIFNPPHGSFYFVEDNETIENSQLDVFKKLLYDFKDIITLENINELVALCKLQTPTEGEHEIKFKGKTIDLQLIQLSVKMVYLPKFYLLPLIFPF